MTSAEIKKNQIAFNRLNRALRKRIVALEKKMAVLEASPALDLGDYVSVVMVRPKTANGRQVILPTLRLEGGQCSDCRRHRQDCAG